VFGEPVAVLLHELAAHTGDAELVDDGMLGLRAAEQVRGRFDRLDPHELEAAAVLRVARQVTAAARESGLQARSLQERALLLGRVSRLSAA
jgi:hypothetical protein